MGVKRSSRACNDWKICAEVFVGFILIWATTNSLAATNPVDVAAINRLFVALGLPQLPGWVQSGGDPCLEAWQGVQCSASDIITIILNGANLGGELGDSLGDFASITVLDLSNNHIGGSIPPNLPVTLKILFLSANQFSGSIPSSVATLTLLTDMSLNNNLLSGEIPDAFESLTGLINLDLSTNNLSGQLPPTLENLSLLTTLHLQDNQLSGTLDVLQDLPLKDLNIENNLFSGTIPDKMLQSITNFRKDGNPYNTPISPPTSSVTSPPSILVPGAPPPPSQSQHGPGKQDGPSTSEKSTSGGKKFLTTKELGLIAIGGAVSFAILSAIGLVATRMFRTKPDPIPKSISYTRSDQITDTTPDTIPKSISYTRSDQITDQKPDRKPRSKRDWINDPIFKLILSLIFGLIFGLISARKTDPIPDSRLYHPTSCCHPDNW